MAEYIEREALLAELEDEDYECMWHYCPNCGAKMDGGNNNA